NAVAADKELETVLARVPGPRDEGMDARDVAVAETEVRDGVEPIAGQQLLSSRSLKGDEGELKRPVLDLYVRRSVVPKPPQVLLAVGGVDDHNELLAAAV